MIDCCLDVVDRTPVALNYLEDCLGLDASSNVKFIAITHWHDDHVRGAAELLEGCTNARLFCSAALRTDEFFQLVLAAESLPIKPSAAVAEFGSILKTLETRGMAGPEWLVADKRFFVCGADQARVELWALSPSNAAITVAKQALGALIPVAGTPKARIVRQGANDVAAAILVRAGEGAFQILLGSDLEVTSSTDRGWAAVIASSERPQEQAHVFKIPHHGSPNADHPNVWATMLAGHPVALVAPFGRGVTPRPDPADMSRIRSRTKNAFITATRSLFRPRERRPSVEAVLKQTARQRRALWGTDMGHIRVRKELGVPGPPSVELFARAKKL